MESGSNSHGSTAPAASRSRIGGRGALEGVSHARDACRSGADPGVDSRAIAIAQPVTMSAADRALAIPELVWGIMGRLSSVDAAHVASASSTLRAIGLADEVWRPRLRALWKDHAYVNGVPADVHGESGEWWAAWTFVGRYEHMLGFWGSNEPYKGRLLRVSLDRALLASVGHFTLRDRLFVRADHVDIANAYDAPDAEDDLPPLPHAAHWDQSSSSYMFVADPTAQADSPACRSITTVPTVACRSICSTLDCSTSRSPASSRPTAPCARRRPTPTPRRSTL